MTQQDDQALADLRARLTDALKKAPPDAWLSFDWMLDVIWPVVEPWARAQQDRVESYAAQQEILGMSHRLAVARAEAAEAEIARYKHALQWAYDRLSIDGRMTAKETERTVTELRRVLAGQSSPAATYQPSEWDDSFRLSRPTPAQETE